MGQDKIAVSIREAAAMLSISPRQIQYYIRDPKVLPSRKIGRRTVIPVRALRNFMRSDHPSPSVKVIDAPAPPDAPEDGDDRR